MWQTIVVLFVIAAVLIYVIRHYARVLRGESSMCRDCSKCCVASHKNAFECSEETTRLIEKIECGQKAVKDDLGTFISAKADNLRLDKNSLPDRSALSEREQ